ncbi:MAG: sugar phosphate nucleotidyltransferase [Candidatus Saccharimonadales bacterium]
MKQPTKAIICAAGLGTRFLPQTKAMPKEMLPIIDKPVIQLVVEEAVAAGVTEIIIVTGYTKRSIEDHFDRSDELEAELRSNGKEDKANRIKAIAEMANFIYIRQKGSPKGNARPVLNAQHLIDDDEPFFVFAADDFFSGKIPRAVQMKEAYNKTGKSVICLNEVQPADADKYGMAALGADLGDGTFEVKELVEKPGEANRPSNYMSPMGYLLTPDIFPILSKEKVDRKGEITMSENINVLAKQGKVCGQVIEGVYRDTGSPVKYIQTVVDMALESLEYGEDFLKYLKERLG